MSKAWATLSAIDCSKHVEKKAGLSYLSWAWAWATLMEEFPSSAFAFHPDQSLEDGSVMVSCTVTVEGQPRTMWLPVMDNRNNAIKHPDARKISDARMRCLVKAIAMHGLGLYIYAGEDLPQAAQDAAESPITEEQFLALNAELDATESDKEKFCALFKIASLKEMKQGDLDKAMTMLASKKAKLEKDNAKS